MKSTREARVRLEDRFQLHVPDRNTSDNYHNRSVSIYLICLWESTHFRRKTDMRTWPLLAESIRSLPQHMTTSIATKKYFHSERLLYGLLRNAHEYYDN